MSLKTHQKVNEVPCVHVVQGTGTSSEMAIEERQALAVEGIIIASVDIVRDSVKQLDTVAVQSISNAAAAAQAAAAKQRLRARIRITTRAMWVDGGRLLEQLHSAAEGAIARLRGDANLTAVERVVADAMRRVCKQYNGRRPDVIVIAHEADPRAALSAKGETSRKRWDTPPGKMNDHTKAGRSREMLHPGKGGELDELGPASGESSACAMVLLAILLFQLLLSLAIKCAPKSCFSHGNWVLEHSCTRVCLADSSSDDGLPPSAARRSKGPASAQRIGTLENVALEGRISPPELQRSAASIVSQKEGSRDTGVHKSALPLRRRATNLHQGKPKTQPNIE